MAKPISENEFTLYRAQAESRGVKLHCLLSAHGEAYQSCRKWSDILNWATAILAIATAVLAIFSKTGNDAIYATGTAVSGGLTGAVAVLKQTFSWDEKKRLHQELMGQVRSEIMNIRQWLESLARGTIDSEEEAFLLRLDTALVKLENESEFQNLDTWSEDAARKFAREVANITYVVRLRVVEAVADEEAQIVPAADVVGVRRAVRGQ